MSHCPCFVRGEWEKAGLWADNHMFTVLEQRFEILFRWHSLWLEEVKGSSQARNGARHTKPNHRQPLPLIITTPTSSCSVSHSTSRGLLSGRLSSASPWSQDRDLSPSRSCTVCLICTQVCSVRGLTQPYWYLPNPATLLMGGCKAVTVLIIVWRASVCTGGSPVVKISLFLLATGLARWDSPNFYTVVVYWSIFTLQIDKAQQLWSLQAIMITEGMLIMQSKPELWQRE